MLCTWYVTFSRKPLGAAFIYYLDYLFIDIISKYVVMVEIHYTTTVTTMLSYGVALGLLLATYDGGSGCGFVIIEDPLHGCNNIYIAYH